MGYHRADARSGEVATPHIDALVAGGVELDRHYVHKFCSPSRSQILTGRYAWHLGQQTDMNLNPMPGVACGINLEYSFMPRLLKERAGYATWALGKWHQGFLTNAYTPTYRGFDTYLGYYSGAEEHFTHEKVGFPLPPGTNGSGGYTAYDLANNSGADVRPCLGAVGNASRTYSAFLYGNETLRLLAAHGATTSPPPTVSALAPAPQPPPSEPPNSIGVETIGTHFLLLYLSQILHPSDTSSMNFTSSSVHPAPANIIFICCIDG